MDSSMLGGLVIILVVVVVLFIVLRSVTLWYFKIETMIDLLQKQLNNQRAILKHLTKNDPDFKADEVEPKKNNW